MDIKQTNMKKPSKPVPTLLELEARIMTSDLGNLTETEFNGQIWDYLCYNKKAVRQYARSLNVFPTLGNVHYAVMQYFTN